MTCKICGKPFKKINGKQKTCLSKACVKENIKREAKRYRLANRDKINASKKKHRDSQKQYDPYNPFNTYTEVKCPVCNKKHIVTGKVDRAKRVYCEKHEYLRAA